MTLLLNVQILLEFFIRYEMLSMAALLVLRDLTFAKSN